MGDKIKAIFKNKDVLNRIMFTFAIFLVYRIGSAITVPGVTLSADAFSGTDALGLLNLMGGGALASFSVFALGVSPYITAQIIVQLLSMDVLPVLTELSKEGETGRRKINMVSRILTLVLGAVQAYGITVTMQNSQGLTMNDTSVWGYVKIVVYLLAGSMLLMWMGDQITEKGIGNGVSMIIFAGIVAAFPKQIVEAFQTFFTSKLSSENATLILEGSVELIFYFLAFFLIVVFVTFTEKSVRKLPVSHSNTSQALGAESVQSSFLPIKINSSGVMPIIFASSVMMAPSIIASLFIGNNDAPGWVTQMEDVFNYQKMTSMPGGWEFPWGLIIYLFLIVVFSFFYANIQINPQRIAENFQNSGTYITGLRPGNETEAYIGKIVNRVTFLGAAALLVICCLPIALSLSGAVPQSLALGGSGLIIVVGVAIEVWNQLDGILAGKSFQDSVRI